MMWKTYKLDSRILKTIEPVTLWQTQKGIIKIGENTLAISVKLSDRLKGYVFHGEGKLLLDTIVETEEGAVGNPIENELIEPFLMLGNAEEIGQHLKIAVENDLAKMGYENPDKFIAKAEDLFNKFFRKKRMHHPLSFGQNHGLIFAFPSREGKLDVLITKGSKLVYKATKMIFVSNKDKVVLKSPSSVVVSRKGKLIVIEKNAFLHNC